MTSRTTPTNIAPAYAATTATHDRIVAVIRYGISRARTNRAPS
jgi:hypothetical protein